MVEYEKLTKRQRKMYRRAVWAATSAEQTPAQQAKAMRLRALLLNSHGLGVLLMRDQRQYCQHLAPTANLGPGLLNFSQDGGAGLLSFSQDGGETWDEIGKVIVDPDFSEDDRDE